MFDPHTLVMCLEQKVILLTNILDLTKQIEVQAAEEDAQLDALITQRQAAMGRIDKCCALIDQLLEELPEAERSTWNTLLGGQAGPAGGNADEETAHQLSVQYRNLLSKVAELDKRANEILRRQHTELQELLNQIRTSKKSGPRSYLHEAK